MAEGRAALNSGGAAKSRGIVVLVTRNIAVPHQLVSKLRRRLQRPQRVLLFLGSVVRNLSSVLLLVRQTRLENLPGGLPPWPRLKIMLLRISSHPV